PWRWRLMIAAVRAQAPSGLGQRRRGDRGKAPEVGEDGWRYGAVDLHQGDRQPASAVAAHRKARAFDVPPPQGSGHLTDHRATDHAGHMAIAEQDEIAFRHGFNPEVVDPGYAQRTIADQRSRDFERSRRGLDGQSQGVDVVGGLPRAGFDHADAALARDEWRI